MNRDEARSTLTTLVEQYLATLSENAIPNTSVALVDDFAVFLEPQEDDLSFRCVP